MASLTVARRKSGNVGLIVRKYVARRYTAEEDLLIINSILDQGKIGNFNYIREKLPHRTVSSLSKRWNRIQQRLCNVYYPLSEEEFRKINKIRGVMDENADIVSSQITRRSRSKKLKDVKEDKLTPRFKMAAEKKYEAPLAIANKDTKEQWKRSKFLLFFFIFCVSISFWYLSKMSYS